jgi:anaerobic magnesium-protoporphyrin IX monomethyl ester cyclase
MTVPKWAHVSSICPPLGLAYVAAALRKAGFEPRCVDGIGEAPLQRIALENSNFLIYGLSPREIVERVGTCDIVGLSIMFSHDWPLGKSIMQGVRNNNPNVIIIAGGEHVNAVPEFCLQDCPELDICVLGEGEETSVELLQALDHGTDLSHVPGTAYRANGAAVRNARRARISQLDEIPWPAWDLFPLENYLANKLGYGVNPRRTVPILASRGCPFECTFCSSPQMWTRRWQARSTDTVIAEMEYYIEKYGAQNFDFYDLTAIIRKDWVLEFCQKILDRQWQITWQMPAGTRSEALDSESLRMMYRSGQRNISYAPESGSAATLERIKKKVALERMIRSIRAALKEKLNVKLNVIMGFPHETSREIFATLAFLLRMAFLGVHDAYIACYSPYPGSELFITLKQQGKIKDLDSAYFLMLTSYSDLKHSYSYSPHLSNRLLKFYRLGGMSMFYATSYLVRPARLLKVIRNLIQGKQESRLDVGLHSIKDRILSKKVRLQDIGVDRTARLVFLVNMNLLHKNFSPLLRKPAWVILLPLALELLYWWSRVLRTNWLQE